MEIRNERWVEKALDLHGNQLMIFLGSQQLFSAKVNIHIDATDLEQKRIIRAFVAVFVDGRILTVRHNEH
jgi:hypothetical protein